VASTTRFVRMVGQRAPRRDIMSCRRYSASEAQAMGLVHQVVPAADLGKAVADYAEMLSKKPARPLAEMKARINTIARVGIPEVNAMTEGFLDRTRREGAARPRPLAHHRRTLCRHAARDLGAEVIT
jgi:enoyl-CoA hydratase/carnithine racemase